MVSRFCFFRSCGHSCLYNHRFNGHLKRSSPLASRFTGKSSLCCFPDASKPFLTRRIRSRLNLFILWAAPAIIYPPPLTPLQHTIILSVFVHACSCPFSPFRSWLMHVAQTCIDERILFIQLPLILHYPSPTEFQYLSYRSDSIPHRSGQENLLDPNTDKYNVLDWRKSC